MGERFLDWLRWAIQHVGDGYFGHSERVYCYELYHLIRVKMYMYERQNPPLRNLFLHSELVKRIITQEEADFHNVWPLEALRIPDFLFHTPGNFDNQIATMEVKVVELQADDFYDDLSKLSDMIERYNYQIAIFHCINNSLNRLRLLIHRMNGEWVALNPNIIIFIRENFHSRIQELTLGELIERVNRPII
ncbi:hypothetical protein [Pantoea ananatis]|uniref:hypothetical protein n=1 Tax=Pantoea ananas TaxID=553 RepID=UPI00157590E0|nr:hypothetical protein [Pantoea ananatis]NQE76868.1 hypothetical protein [Pantoea ananatis]NQE81504.1 hypothetical protein [Pantoea ananatis]